MLMPQLQQGVGQQPALLQLPVRLNRAKQRWQQQQPADTHQAPISCSLCEALESPGFFTMSTDLREAARERFR